eukprot:gene16962-18671_t
MFLEKLSKVEETADLLKHRPLPANKRKSSAFEPHPVWSSFSTQQQALDYRNICKTRVNKNVHVFAQELSGDAKRRYIVTTHKQFWGHHTKLRPSKRNFYEVISEVSKPPEDLQVDKLIVKNRTGDLTFFCDLSVYSRNRNFRIYGSTKFGKSTPLKLAEQNCFDVKMLPKGLCKLKEDPDFIFFLSSLVCFDEDCCDENDKVLQFGEASSLHKYCFSQCVGQRRPQATGYKTSPYPNLDKFVTKTATKGGVQGVIRQWKHFSQGNLIIYDIDRNHWCENVGRPHKSNHIYIVIDLRLGVYYQKCHDPDCQLINFKSEEKSLPVDVNPLMNDSDYVIDDFDDSVQDLIEAAELAESSFFGKDEDAKTVEDDILTSANQGEFDGILGNNFDLSDAGYETTDMIEASFVSESKLITPTMSNHTTNSISYDCEHLQASDSDCKSSSTGTTLSSTSRVLDEQCFLDEISPSFDDWDFQLSPDENFKNMSEDASVLKDDILDIV